MSVRFKHFIYVSWIKDTFFFNFAIIMVMCAMMEVFSCIPL